VKPLRRTLFVVAVASLLGVGGSLVYVSVSSTVGARSDERPGAAEARPGEEARAEGASAELQEQAEATQERLDALRAARREGRFGTQALTGTPAAGWAGEQVVNAGTDDWEPAVAADPNAPWVYVLVTRYGVPKPCSGNCPVPYIAIERSSDGGKTWTEGAPLCACKGSGQFDPIIEVVPDTGDVYALWMNGFNVYFQRSTDHGKTWSEPAPTFGNVSWNDKDVLATSDDGRDVYVSWNGPTGGDPWVAQSHDGGATWTQTKLVDSRRYFFAFDADVLPDDTAILSESSISYTGPGGSAEGVVEHHAFVSKDGGRTWTDVLVDSVNVGEPCVADGCSSDFYIGHSAVSADAGGDLVYLYDGATTDLGPQRIYARRSSDGGLTWTARVALSVDGENATGPAVEQTGDGDVRAWYMQTAGHDPDVWNVWYRTSANGGASWSAPVKISDAGSGAEYKTANGFLEVYGDYGEIAITSRGKTFAAWGEGFSWTGPGGVWFNREL
jgi:BNR repeat protein